MTTETLLLTAPPPSNRTSPSQDAQQSPPHDTRQSPPQGAHRPASRDMKRAIAVLDNARQDGAAGDPLFATARLDEAVRRAGTVELDRTKSHPAGAHLDAAFRVLAVDHGSPWPLARWSHHRELLRAMVQIARARLALIRGQRSVARERLSAARSALKHLGDAETRTIRLRTAKAVFALDEAERHLEDSALKAA